MKTKRHILQALERTAADRGLVVRALGRLEPEGDPQGWLREPNPDLGSRTPQEAMEAGDYELVIEALWLRDPAGPVS
jgi:hypothetical protein